MTNTVAQQPTYASLLTTDYILIYQGSQSPPTRKLPVSGLDTYYALLSGATFSGNVTITSANFTLTGGTVNIPAADAASTEALRADQTWQKIATYTLSGASSQAIPLDSAFQRYRLTAQNATVGTNNASIEVQFSADGGSTYIATGYTTAQFAILTSGSTTSGASTNASAVAISSNLTSPAGGHAWDSVSQIWPGASGTAPRVTTDGYGKLASGDLARVMLGGGLDGAGAIYDYMKLLPSTGTISGTFILEGLP